MQLPAWQATNQAALVAALRPVYAALCRVAGRDSPEEEPAPDPAAANSTSALDVLCALFGLTAFERDLLLLCAGVELEGRFAEICALAHRELETDLAYIWLGIGGPARRALERAHTRPAAPLLAHARSAAGRDAGRQSAPDR